MGLSPAEFWEFTPADFARKAKGYWKKMDRQMEEHSRLIRMQTWWLVNIQLTPETRLNSPTDLWGLPSEQDAEADKTQLIPLDTSAEKAEEIRKRFELAQAGLL